MLSVVCLSRSKIEHVFVLACTKVKFIPPYSFSPSSFTAQLPGWTYNTSRDLCTYIHPENTTSVLSPTGICSLPPYLLIVICSAVANLKARTAIRDTWANKKNLDSIYNSTVKIAFLLGESDNDTLNVGTQ